MVKTTWQVLPMVTTWRRLKENQSLIRISWSIVMITLLSQLPLKLNREYYLQWFQSIKLLICECREIEYLIGATLWPQEWVVLIEMWKAKNAMIMSRLINSMEANISKTYMFVPIVREIERLLWRPTLTLVTWLKSTREPHRSEIPSKLIWV